MLKYIYMYINMYKLQLHYANGHGLRDPGVGGQEDVIEQIVGGAPFLVRASGTCVYVYIYICIYIHIYVCIYKHRSLIYKCMIMYIHT